MQPEPGAILQRLRDDAPSPLLKFLRRQRQRTLEIGGGAFRHAINQVESSDGQRAMIDEFFARQADLGGKAAPAFSALSPTMAVAAAPAEMAA